MANPVEYMQDVRAEARKVTWPSRRETLITTVLVLVMVVFAAIFFTVVDEIVHFAIGFLTSLGR